MLQNFGLYLNLNEMLAIRYHMGAWDGAMWTNDLKYAYSTAISMMEYDDAVRFSEEHNIDLILYKDNEIYTILSIN